VQFTAKIQAFNGVTSVFSETVTSDLAGDAVFLGVQDTTAEINRVIISLSTPSGTVTTGNFVVDKVYLQESPSTVLVFIPAPAQGDAPEPGIASLVGSGLLVLVFGLRKRSARA